MTNKEKYDNIFIEVFAIDPANLDENFGKDTIDAWDSVHQLNLVNLAEDNFDVMLDPEQILEFTSYSKGMQILESLGIEF